MRLKTILLLLLPTMLLGQVSETDLTPRIDTCSFCIDAANHYSVLPFKLKNKYQKICCELKCYNIISAENHELISIDSVYIDNCNHIQHHHFIQLMQNYKIMEYSTSEIEKGVIVDVDSVIRPNFIYIYTLKIDTTLILTDSITFVHSQNYLTSIIKEEMPLYPGGDYARISFLSENCRFPLKAKESGVNGSVNLTFVINLDGSVTNVQILKGIGYGCDEEAIRVVQLMPNWTPGKINGKQAMFRFYMPVKFTVTY